MGKRINKPTIMLVTAMLSILMLSLAGCRHQERTDQAIVDSIFDSYHNAEKAFGKKDIARLQRYADSSGSHYGQILAHLDMASVYITNSNQAEALRHLEMVEVKPTDPPFALAYTDFIHGLAHQYNTDFNKALFYYKRAAYGFEHIDRTQALATTYTNMSEIYSEFEAWDLHEKYSNMAKELFRDSMVVGYYRITDSIYTLIHQGHLAEAAVAWRQHDRIFEELKTKNELQFAYCYNHYDQAQTIHYELGHYDTAARYNEILTSLVAESQKSTIHTDLTLTKAKILVKQGKPRESMALCLQLLDSAGTDAVPPNIAIEVYPTLLECYSALHMWEQTSLTAIEYSNKLKRYTIEAQRNNLLQDQIEQRYEQLLTQAKQERQQLHNRLMGVAILSLVIILALMGVVIYKQRRQHAEQSLRLKSEQELDAAQNQLAESQMKQAKIQEQILTYTEQMRELASDMPKRLKAKTFLNLEQIKQQRDADAWASFEEAFEKAHGKYKERLEQEYPQLNSTDLKICMLMRTGMPSKDIANMLHITPESLRTFRYNLRKKLGLQELGMTLEEFVKRG